MRITATVLVTVKTRNGAWYFYLCAILSPVSAKLLQVVLKKAAGSQRRLFLPVISKIETIAAFALVTALVDDALLGDVNNLNERSAGQFRAAARALVLRIARDP